MFELLIQPFIFRMDFLDLLVVLEDVGFTQELFILFDLFFNGRNSSFDFFNPALPLAFFSFQLFFFFIALFCARFFGSVFLALFRLFF